LTHYPCRLISYPQHRSVTQQYLLCHRALAWQLRPPWPLMCVDQRWRRFGVCCLWRWGRLAAWLADWWPLNYVPMRGAIFCSLSPNLVFRGRGTSSRRSSPCLRPSVPEPPWIEARLVWMRSKNTARECLNDFDYLGHISLSNSTTLCVILVDAPPPPGLLHGTRVEPGLLDVRDPRTCVCTTHRA
jgi:hypothetical protein